MRFDTKELLCAAHGRAVGRHLPGDAPLSAVHAVLRHRPGGDPAR